MDDYFSQKKISTVPLALAFLTFVFFIVLTAYYLLVFKEGNCASTSKDYLEYNSYLGDAVNGWTAPFIGLLTAFLTFVAFYVQYQFNKQQNDRITKLDDENLIQNFDSTFFNLLNNHHRIINTLIHTHEETGSFNHAINKYIEGEKRTYSGVKYLKHFVRLIDQEISNKENSQEDSYVLRKEEIIDIYNKLFFSQHYEYLSHFLRNLFITIKYIDSRNLPSNGVLTFKDGEDEMLSLLLESESIKLEVEKRKYDYTKILRAQFSDDELILLAINALTEQGKAFELYVRKYRLIKNITATNVSHSLNKFMNDYYPQTRNQTNHG